MRALPGWLSRLAACVCFCLIFACSAAVVFAAEKKEPSADVFTIGAILPLSGSYASFGEASKKAMEYALQQLPAEQRGKVHVVFEDDQLQATKSIAAFNKLRSSDHARAFIAFGSGIGHALAPLAEREQVPLISVGASDLNVVKSRDFTFLHWVSPEAEMQVMVEEIMKRGYKRLAIATGEQQGWIACHDALQAQLRKTGLQDRVVIDERFLVDNVDFQTFIAKVRSRQVDGVIFLIMPEPVVALVKQLRGSGVKADLIGAEMFEDRTIVDATGDLLYGQWYVSSDDALPDFGKNFRAATGSAPGFGAANGYDCFNLVVEGAVGRGLEGRALADFLHNLKDYRGAAGEYSATSDNRFSLPAAVKVITPQGFKKLY